MREDESYKEGEEDVRVAGPYGRSLEVLLRLTSVRCADVSEHNGCAPGDMVSWFADAGSNLVIVTVWKRI